MVIKDNNHNQIKYKWRRKFNQQKNIAANNDIVLTISVDQSEVDNEEKPLWFACLCDGVGLAGGVDGPERPPDHTGSRAKGRAS